MTSYTAVMLDKKSMQILKNEFLKYLPDGWEWVGHHMTIKPGVYPDDIRNKILGTSVTLKITALGISDMAMAVKVDGYPTEKNIPHITLAINRKEGAKPHLSNEITNWKPYNIKENLTGIVEESANSKKSEMILDIKDLPFYDEIISAGGKLYQVGGAVRDSFLGKKSKDLDILITNVPKNELESILAKHGKVDSVGESFGIIKFTPPGGEEIDIAIPRTEKPSEKSTIILRFKNKSFEINYKEPDGQISPLSESSIDSYDQLLEFLSNEGFPIDSNIVIGNSSDIIKSLKKLNPDSIKIKKGYTAFDVTSDPFLPIEKDLERRDFTINSIAKDSEGNIIDPFNGLEDLRNKVIKVTNPSAFSDDPLRMLRAVQFAARFGFTIEPNTMRLIKANAPKIREISNNRILIEFDKIVEKGNPKIGAELLIDSNLYENIFNTRFKGDLNNFDNVTTIAEFIYFLIAPFTDNPDEYYKKNMSGSNEVTTQISALDDIFSNYPNGDKEKQRWLYYNVNKKSPDMLNNYHVKKALGGIETDFVSGRYPDSIKKLDINGGDLIKLGFKGKATGDALELILGAIYADEMPNEKQAILQYAYNLPKTLSEALNREIRNKKKAVFFDFDGTLMNSPTPENGKRIYKEKTGKEYPHQGWWGKPESLDTEIFEINPLPKIERVFRKDSADNNNYTILLTNRISKLSDEVIAILDSHGISFDVYSFKSDGRTKGDRILGIINSELKNVGEIIFYDDDINHLYDVANKINSDEYKLHLYHVINGNPIEI